MTRAGPRNKNTIFSMSIHMWQSCQILSIVAAFFSPFPFFSYAQLHVMTINAEQQDKSSIEGGGKEE